MGYYTTFSLDFDADIDLNNEVLDKLEELCGYRFEDDNMLYDVKWYDWELNMRTLSLRYPDILFTLSGVGDENGDLWDAYFKCGKMQFCEAKVVFPEFDESKLE